MKQFIALLIAMVHVFGASAADASFSTEATITPRKDKNQYEVFVRVTQLVKKRGKLTEKPVAIPIYVTAELGEKASAFAGQCGPGKEGVTVDMFCPKQGESDFASCTVTVQRGDKVVSTSHLRLKLDGN
jgi:hypothetical protein